jgi:PAS domain S-box-containing protein
MKSLIRNHGISFAIVLVSLEMLLTVYAAFHNKKMLKEYTLISGQSAEIKSRMTAIQDMGLINVDKDLRAYLISLEPSYLKRIENYIQKDIYNVYIQCEELFARQPVDFPQSLPAMEAFTVQLQGVKQSINEYHGFCQQLVSLAGRDSSMQEIRLLLAQDRGLVPWSRWWEMYSAVADYEDSLVGEVQRRYEDSIMYLNWMLILLLATGLPTLGWILLRIRQDKEKRGLLLKSLEDNNRRYLYNPGETIRLQTEAGIIKQSITHLQQAAGFVRQITQGNYDTRWSDGEEFDQASNQETLAGELMEMREKFIRIRQEEQQRNWISEGLNLISDVLQRNDNLNQLADRLLAALVTYLSANQGAVFIVQDPESGQQPWLEMVGAYAYGRKKYLGRQIYPGQGLAGQAWQEAQTIYLKELPVDYVRITSGLGDASPRNVVIIPLIHDNCVQGILELASFRILEEHHREFLEKAAQNIASVLAGSKINEKTRQLLEQTQQQAEQMRASEEELRQNLEELEATQDEMRRQSSRNETLRQELETREKVFNITTIMSESDIYGTITKVNDKLCEVSQYSPEELIGKPHNIFRHPDMPATVFALLWKNLKQGKSFRGIIKNRAKDGSHYWVDAVISPVFNDAGKVVKYIGVRYVIPDDTLAETMFQRMIADLEKSPAAV